MVHLVVDLPLEPVPFLRFRDYGFGFKAWGLQGYLAHKKLPPP